MTDLASAFVFFFAVIDPIGTVPVFIATTRRHGAHGKRIIAIKSVLIAGMVLISSMIAGEFVLKAISTPFSAFQIAGGIVLFIFALSMIFGERKPEEEVRVIEELDQKEAVFPLAIPSIASPGAMLAAVLLTDNHSHSLWEQFPTTLMMIAVLIITLALMLGATRVHRFINNAGASIISRVMGMILTSVAISNILTGIKVYFQLGP